MSREKELNFFVDELNWNKGIEWYKSNFIGEAKIHGESSPNYTNYPFFAGVPERMYSVVPKAKLIYTNLSTKDARIALACLWHRHL